ncbi:DHODH [Acanthosepion pharaonis]|uniref:Dihydroorotate dehydrogenase (quinone), mitochondrial n=1 Tax=Acanthosepion pharaonis TaxID=158019 RepID=A0A812D503_ACAPH|nr:DHODH [Sepia pharaonis]
MNGEGWLHFLKQVRDVCVIISGGTVCFSCISLYQGNEKFYKQFVMPAVQILNPETAHKIGVALAKYHFFQKPKTPDPPILKTNVWGHEFRNPVGLAAGFDKHGEAVDGILKMGFGFLEVGSITPEPQPGKEKPRVFRLTEDKAIINRYGFNSDGHKVVYKRLADREERQKIKVGSLMSESRNMLNINFWTESFSTYITPSPEPGILGINLGKNKDSLDAANDYVQGVRLFGELADFLVINISSPNTSGLRDLQAKENLENLINKVVTERNQLKCGKKPPLLVKISPDLTDKDKEDIAEVVIKEKNSVDGLIISNTTVSRSESLISSHQKETGGLSGAPLKHMSTLVLRDMYSLTQGKLPIIGVGGISSGKDAYDKIKAGASLVELYTALAYQGPVVVNKIKRELAELLEADGYTSVADAVGADHKKKP